MKNFFIARIKWISAESGGRKTIPPIGTRYCPIIQILNDSGHNEWSIDFICPNFNETDLIKFSFLSNEAPYGLLKLYKSYSLLEGAKKVAIVQILDKN